MTLFDNQRMHPGVFDVDHRMRSGRYTDQYFLNVRNILERLAEENYRFAGKSPILEDRPLGEGAEVGNMEAEMQVFTKRRPFSIICGADNVLAILRECTGYWTDDASFQSSAPDLEVEAVMDGEKAFPRDPCLKIRGRYRDYGYLETPILGTLARQTAVATNTYRLLEAADGKPVFFFPARYDLPETQSADGYAYKVGLDAYNNDTGRELPALITSGAQGEWWGAEGGGTVSHSYILCFLGDCAEAMLHFCRTLPPEVNRIALVDTTNDCVGTSVDTALTLFRRYMELRQRGENTEAGKYTLYGVRCDTAGNLRDSSVEPLGDPALDCGVVPRQITAVRRALDNLHQSGEVPARWEEEARRYFRNIRIFVSGGFGTDKIARFEKGGAPVDGYGVGSAFFGEGRNDFTADVVRVKLNGKWVHMAKSGRRAMPNNKLRECELNG
ncbi:MAG: nicotinate phosphoribosyltransferase [Planctomycetota bacterium]